MNNYKDINKILFRIISFVLIIYILFLPINNKSKPSFNPEKVQSKEELANFFKKLEANPLLLYENQPNIEASNLERGFLEKEKSQGEVELPNVLIPLSE